MNRVVITGLGAVTPLGNDVPTTWQALCEGRSGCFPITKFDVSKFKTRFACQIQGFDIESILCRKEARKLSLNQQYAIAATHEAVTDSGLDFQAEDSLRTAVIYGTAMGGYQTIVQEITDHVQGDGTPRFTPFFMCKILANMTAGHLSLRYGIKGASFTMSSACASSTHAIIQAADQIRLGRADVVITGGTEESVSYPCLGAFNALHAISTRNDDPARASRPFSASRDGFVIAEGAATLILESLDHALARGAKIYGEVVGGGITSDAYHMTAPAPDGEGARRAMQAAIADAGIRPEQVDHINTHGTSTPLGDVVELQAIQSLFGEHAYQIALTSTKSMTGHLMGAAGAVEAIATVLALRDGIVPPTINHDPEDKDEKIDYNLDIVFNEAKRKPMHYAISNTFGFGGHNGSILFKRWEP